MDNLINDFKKKEKSLKEDGLALLNHAVSTGDLGKALRAYQTVEDILPSDTYMPPQNVFPLFDKYIRGKDYQRYETRGYLDSFEESVWFFSEATKEEQDEALVDGSEWFKPYDDIPLLWEIVKGGKKSFTWDW